MSDTDEVKRSINNEIESCNEFLDKAKDVSDLTPAVLSRKQEAEVKFLAISAFNSDEAEEFASKILPMQKRSEERLKTNLPQLPNIGKYVYLAVSSSGTSSAYEDAVIVQANIGPDGPRRMEPVLNAFNDLAIQKRKTSYLFSVLDKIQPGIGELFTKTCDDIEKAKAGLIGIDQSVIRMRDTIEQIWGGLCEQAKSRSEKPIKYQHLELKKQNHKALIASILAKSSDEAMLLYILDSISNLHQVLSQICKQSNFNDINELKNLQSRWILYLDDLMKWLSFI